MEDRLTCISACIAFRVGSRLSVVGTLIRRATPDERDVLSQMLAAYLFEFDGQTKPYRYFEAYWSQHDRVPFFIEADGEIAGFCLVRLRAGAWTIAEFTVVPESRRKGVGRRAVVALSDSARGDGAAYIEATVQPEKTDACAFWLACGFRVVDEGDVIVTRFDLQTRPTNVT
jgi:ribosomal protein S18 acetylase RimI-like enzyme